MPIRITGMYSGLDTEAIISELVSAQSVKKSKYVKDQTKLSWKMDAWKALNTKVYNFYTNTLDNMRFQASYMKKTTKVSKSDILSVVTSNNAIDGVQNVTVDKLATSGKLTGRELARIDGGKVTSSTKLSDLGFTGDASFDVTVGGKTTTIKINGDTKIGDVISKLKNAGVSASFDETNRRFFISSTASGKDANFTITANDENGLNALNALGLVTKEDLENDEYKLWASYKDDEDAYKAALAAEVQKRADSYKKANDNLEAKNKTLAEELDKLKENENYTSVDGKTDREHADELYDELYGTMQDKYENGEPVTDDEGNTVQERQGGLQQQLDAAKEALTTAKEALKAAQEAEDTPQDELDRLSQAVEDAQSAVNDAQTAFDDKKAEYNAVKAVADKQAQIDANNNEIDKNQQYYNVDLTMDDDGNTVESVWGSSDLQEQVKAEFDKKVDLAYDIVNNNKGFSADDYGTKINGENAQITLDGAIFTSSSNDFTINGMTITVYQTTGANESVMLTTSTDVDGIYDMIKNFFTEYNSLINEMDKLYNADSAKGYDPLTSEEKSELSDSEIEEWEKKIKDSLLRRDSTLGDLTDAIKSVMLQGAKVNGKTMYLSDFGINTLGYWNAADNEKGAYHIDGDPDDANTKSNDDILKSMIATDPDTVMNFFSGLSKNLYDKLTEKMSAIKDTSSMFTVYNDLAMQKEYKAYTEKIAKQEEKLNSLMDKWYEKFSQMETALAKLQSKNNGLTSMLGGGS